ncbi:neuropeptide CCHamide-2-like [Planococcus citri]|uniref:neuropeptide CCHamide-2-like n=1 Tax=Planococcus citri TaxID=170843 RepID=UPI0031F86C43
MCALKTCSHFVIFVVFFVSLNAVLAKRGCAQFGHSCYGGHGKRSQGFDSFSPDRFVDVDVSNSRLPLREHETPGSEQFTDMSAYNSVGKPVDRFATILQKLAKTWEEQEQLQHRNYQRVY